MSSKPPYPHSTTNPLHQIWTQQLYNRLCIQYMDMVSDAVTVPLGILWGPVGGTPSVGVLRPEISLPSHSWGDSTDHSWWSLSDPVKIHLFFFNSVSKIIWQFWIKIKKVSHNGKKISVQFEGNFFFSFAAW